jgi:copper(I)-binding protein
MSGIIHRREVLRAGLVLCASLAVPSARACEFITSTLRVTHPWTRATSANATHAVLCTRFDQVSITDRLIGVQTPVASGAELVVDGVSGKVDFLIPAGRETFLSDDGTHVRLTGLEHPLEVGRSYPLTLVFEKGGEVQAQLNVDYGLRLVPFPGGQPSFPGRQPS